MIGMKYTTHHLVNNRSLNTVKNHIRLIRGLLHRKVTTKRQLRRVRSTNTLTKNVHNHARHPNMIVRPINNLGKMTTTIPSNNTFTINPLSNLSRGFILSTKGNRTIMMPYLHGASRIITNLQNRHKRGRNLRRTHQNVRRHSNITHHQINRLRLNKLRHQTKSEFQPEDTTRLILRQATHRHRATRRHRRHRHFFVGAVRGSSLSIGDVMATSHSPKARRTMREVRCDVFLHQVQRKGT